MPTNFGGAIGKLDITQGSSQGNATGGVTNMTKGATIGSMGPMHGLGFSIDLTKLKATPDDNDGGANDYQLDGAQNPKPQDFQDEFMAKYDEFSESWRMMLRK